MSIFWLSRTVKHKINSSVNENVINLLVADTEPLCREFKISKYFLREIVMLVGTTH